MVLEGQIEDIIYQNEVNAYTIAVLDSEDEIFTIVGYLPFINKGDSVKVEGKFVTHQEYGRQFKVETFEKTMPKTLDALERYLANGIIKGVGPSTAKKIVETFGEDTINVLKFEPEKLSQIKGISLKKAEEIVESFNENNELWQLVGFLEKFGIGAANAQRIHKELGSNAINVIEENPYVLVDMVRGVDFKQIDKMALDIGIGIDNTVRVKSGIKYSLIIASLNGNTCVLEPNLISFVKDLLKISEDAIENAFIELKVKNEIYIESREDGDWVYLAPFYEAEYIVAEKIINLENSKNVKEIKKIDKEIKTVEKENDIELSDKQKEAIKLVNEKNVCIITGGPGTGKTTVIKSIIDLYKKQGKKVVLCAPTGRAAKRMTETTGEEAKTLHRLLEIGKTSDDAMYETKEISITPIDADVIIVDEVSMVDIFLMSYLLKGVYLGTKLVLVGDVDQLPSVGPGCVLKDLISSEKVPTIHLDKIFRQAAKSKIIVNAHNVNNGEGFIKEKNEEMLDDFFYINEVNQEKMLYQIVSLCKERLKNYGDYDFFNNIQVIVPNKKGSIGTIELNKILQQELNPEDDHKKEKKANGCVFREGDRVMQIKNNYDMFWEKNTGSYESGNGVFNGELGIIKKIDDESKAIKVKFDDDKEAWYQYQDLEQLEHSYAITVHKSQGSEFDVVIIPVTQNSPMLLTRNLLYTALTRAKKLLIIIGSNKVIDFMIQNTDSKKRNTGLAFKLINIEL